MFLVTDEFQNLYRNSRSVSSAEKKSRQLMHHFETHFVFALAGHIMATEDNSKVMPLWIILKFIADKGKNMLGALVEEGSSGSDAVGMKSWDSSVLVR